MMARLTAAAKMRRDARIVADRARGLRWATIAERHGISDRHARAVWKERVAAEPLESLDGRDSLSEALLQVETMIEELALLAERTNNDAVKLGAIRARAEAMGDRIALLRAVGLMPCSWRAARDESDFRAVGERLTEVFKEHTDELSDELLDEMIAALDEPRIVPDAAAQ